MHDALKLASGMAATAVAASAVAGALVLAGGSGQAHAATVTRTSPATRTCQAFAAWEHHKTARNLDAMMTASELAAWNPIGADTAVLYVDVRDGDHLDAINDSADLAEDCPR